MLGYDHGEEKFQHAILFIQDLLSGYPNTPNDLADRPNFYTLNWTVYVGNSPIWSENPACPGGPHLNSFADYFDDSGVANANVPSFGFEEWCNLPG